MHAFAPLEIDNERAMGYQDGAPVERSSEASTFLPSIYNSNDEAALGRSRLKLLTGLLITAAVAFASGAVLFRSSSSTGIATAESAESQTITLELEGSKKKKHGKSEDDDSDRGVELSCDDGNYSKRTLKLAHELPFASLFSDHKGQRKYEASSVVIVGDDAYAVCDSSWAISKFGKKLTPFAPGNVQIGEVKREEEDSGYEALLYDSGTFYVVRESIKHHDKTYHAIIEELEMNGNIYGIKDQCSTEFEFEGDSKGFEGATAIRDLNNEMVILALCEGNHCSETRKNDKGNGRLVAMRKQVQANPDGTTTSCEWKTIRMINVPRSAWFKDYSAIAMTDSGKVGISSQEESQFWVGHLLGQNTDGLWDIDKLEFNTKLGFVLDFPKNDACETVYCNIEGVNWINDDMIMAVSDKMKGKGKQDFICNDKDQSVHVFVLPE